MKQPIIKYIGSNRWELCESIALQGYEVPRGFVFDLATTPRPLWSIFPPFGAYNAASCIHDYLYINKIGTRKRADKLFFKQMTADKVGVKRYVMYLYVRIFGWLKWKNIL